MLLNHTTSHLVAITISTLYTKPDCILTPYLTTPLPSSPSPSTLAPSPSPPYSPALVPHSHYGVVAVVTQYSLVVVGSGGGHDCPHQVPPKVLDHQAVQSCQHATYGLVGEVFQVLEQINRELKETKRGGEGRRMEGRKGMEERRGEAEGEGKEGRERQ